MALEQCKTPRSLWATFVVTKSVREWPEESRTRGICRPSQADEPLRLVSHGETQPRPGEWILAGNYRGGIAAGTFLEPMRAEDAWDLLAFSSG